MLVYGDAVRRENSADKLSLTERAIRQVLSMPGGIERHAALVGLFLEAGELAQGIADAEFSACGHDAHSPAQARAMSLLMLLARAVGASWESGFDDWGPLPDASVEALRMVRLPERIETKRPEGYAFYALYPEAYFQAALALKSSPPDLVIGIRSIGASLSAMVAAAVSAPPPVTIRPVGHPFRRELALEPRLAACLKSNPSARVAVVDEGPGLSGSSFGAVADFLEEGGIRGRALHFFPGHGGELGPQADPRHRNRWRHAARHVVTLDALILHPSQPVQRLTHWVADLVGEAEEPIEDISGGAWRRQLFASESEWPASHVRQERRKFLVRAGGARWLVKFAGLGREGLRKVELGRALHEAGLSPEIAGYRHGFLVAPWIEARPLSGLPIDRSRLADRVGHYLGVRAQVAGTGPGASLAELWEMTRRNTELALGSGCARQLDRWPTVLAGLESAVHRIETDNRMHAWEWLVTPDGRILKTDALDHHAAHDLIGCQDIAWDIAGGSVELGFSQTEQERLCAAV